MFVEMRRFSMLPPNSSRLKAKGIDIEKIRSFTKIHFLANLWQISSGTTKMRREYTRVQLRRRRALVGEGKACAGCQTCLVRCSWVYEGVVEFGGEIPK